MARKKKNKDIDGPSQEKTSAGGKLVGLFIVLGILILWLITFALLIKMNVGNLGTSLRPLLKNVPVLKYVLPAVSDEQEAYENEYPYSNMEEAIARIKELEAQVDTLATQNTDDAQTISDLQAEVARLKVFEDEQDAFEARVKEFDENVVFNDKAPDIEEYKTYYEAINPDTAAEIYQKVVEKLQLDQSITDEAGRLVAMKASAAASILEQMTASKKLVAQYLMAMKSDEAAAILAEMDPLYAAQIMQKIADIDAAALDEINSELNQ